jgi:cytochrome c553
MPVHHLTALSARLTLTISVALTISGAPYLSGVARGADEAPPSGGAVGRTVQTCGNCHGEHGRSVSPTFPNLAAQTAPYIEAQLKAFKEQTRADPDAQAYMWGMAAQLSDAQIGELAEYFSKQTAAPGKSGDAAMIARGKQVFEQGVPASQIPACASCHGAHAEGLTIFPRLAGQHAPYLLKQLLVIQNALRSAPVMHGVVKDLNKDQMQAVVAYLESI